MFLSLKKLFVNIVPVTLLAVVLFVSFWLVNSDSSDITALLDPPAVPPKVQVASIRNAIDPRASGQQLEGRVVSGSNKSVASEAPRVTTPVTPNAASRLASQSVLVETRASVNSAIKQAPVTFDTPDVDQAAEAGKKNKVWAEINDAIYGLNDIVGDELFLNVKRKQKGQMEIRLDDGLWKRVLYQTRADLKTDISNLWHLYVVEYGYGGSSVVYFIDDTDDRVIDIFSKAN